MDLEDLVGSKLMLGFEGATLTRQTVQMFQKTHAGGLILFRRNFKTLAAFKNLISGLQSTLGRPLLVAMDHEGGRVMHLPQGATFFPDNRAMAQSANIDRVRFQGKIEGQELSSLGIGLSLSPVLDCGAQSSNPALGNRCYGDDTESISRFGQARILGLQEGGVAACVKHFPGLGDTRKDPHHELPASPITMMDLRQSHLAPFKGAVIAGADAVMTTHILFPKIESGKVPVSFSRLMVHEMLREEMRFNGLILTDDLEMGALSRFGDFGERACRAAHAGHDMILICKSSDAQLQAFHGLLQAYDSGKLYRDELEKSYRRIRSLAQRVLPSESNPAFAGAEKRAWFKAAGAEAVAWLKGSSRDCQLGPEDALQIIVPRWSELDRAYAVEKEMMIEKDWILKTTAGWMKRQAQVIVSSLLPEEDEALRIISKIERNKKLILIIYDAHSAAGARLLMQKAPRQVGECGVILLKNPMDIRWVKGKTSCLTAFGFRSAQIRACLQALKGNVHA